MINFDSKICTDFAAASSREWLETNGIGGFAASTVSGANTRRYHGLLVAATRPPLGRAVLLSKFEEIVMIGDQTFELSANQYPGKIYPEGFKYLKNFRLAPFPCWTFQIGEIEIEKKIFMVHGENTTVCQWKISSPKSKVQSPKSDENSSVKLQIKPLLAFRDYHHLRNERGKFNDDFQTAENLISIIPSPEFPALFFAHNAVCAEKTGVWYENFEYEIERERGFDFREDLFQPFALEFDLSEAANIIISTQIDNAYEIEPLEAAEIARRESLIEIAETEDFFSNQLVLAADQFIVRRGEGKTIIAGYPWFSDWGRDTMIALNGLTLATNRPEIARDILLEFAKNISQGMIPNRFPDAGETPEYNTVDATLWYFEATRAYAEKTDDYEFVRANLYDKLIDVLEWHLRGTRYNIRVDTDGLLCAGEAGMQLTWMDAKAGETVFTPRIGKPVEIQALWYNALKITADFADRFDDRENQRKYENIANMARETFTHLFWNTTENCLFDTVENGTRDAAIRPNQIFAVSLPHTMLSVAQARSVVETVEKYLLTPYGLRSLAPDAPEYCPVYIGSPFERDSCYHQGTVWAWLIGAFVDAYRKVHAADSKTESRVAEILEDFKTHLFEAGIGQISEIFDADAPFKPRGCFAQAWSVAEVLRVLKKNEIL